MKTSKLPKTVYVTVSKDGPKEYYLVANDAVDGIESGQTVGIYELKTIKTMKVTATLE
jgi:hypothetical protein